MKRSNSLREIIALVKPVVSTPKGLNMNSFSETCGKSTPKGLNVNSFSETCGNGSHKINPKGVEYET
jgi:hypothetical protein